MRIHPAFFNFTLDNRSLRHDETVEKKFAELALADLGLQAAPAFRIGHHLRRQRWGGTLPTDSDRLRASSDDGCGAGVAAGVSSSLGVVAHFLE